MSARRAAGVLGICTVLAGLSAAPVARAGEAHRIAAVDPDPELARALDVALSPWDARVVQVTLEAPGATMPIAVERARDIARDAHADVVVWVSNVDGGRALWIYDAASDHTGSRALDPSPPFDAATAAAVALAVKTLLRGTVVAPEPERFGAMVREPRWTLGATAGAGAHLGAPVLLEPRLGVQVALWPGAWGHRWGISVRAEAGPGTHPSTGTFSGTVTDAALEVAVATRAPLSGALALEASLGGSVHRIELDGVVAAGASPVSSTRLDAAVDSRLGLTFRTLGGRLLLTPWLGATFFTRWQRFLVRGATAVDLGAVSTEGALDAALAFP